MDENNITLINHLDVQEDDFTVKVRIIRLWNRPLYENPEQIYSIEMILMDEEGTKIHANVLQKWVPKFKILLQEGDAIFIKNPTIAQHASKYKLIDNTNKLSLYYKTSVFACLDFNGSLFGFSFVKYQNVISKMIPEDTSVDVIGEVVAWETMVNFRDDKGKTNRRMQIEIQDLEGLKLHVTLWDAFAEQFNEYVSIHKDEGLVVVVIQFAMVKTYREKPYLSNSFNGTRLFINSEIDEIKDFRNSKDPSTRPTMASSSSSTSSIHKINFKYDVFLSFRGEDTRTNFVDHLYDALRRQNIEAYKDDKNLDKGKKISKELIQAIEESRFHVIVFSKNYASSSWCLDELVKIMECQKTQTGQTVYPIFYNVEPTQVRKQSEEFGKAFSKHENDEAAEKWREAMVEATSFSGRDLSTTADGHEVEFIKLVVKDISSKLPAVSADGNLIGMRTRINGVVSSLNAFPDELCMLGIWGMGGGGKTTLARAVFDQISFQFEGISFVANVREVSKPDFSGLNKLQQQVLRNVSNDQGITI